KKPPSAMPRVKPAQAKTAVPGEGLDVAGLVFIPSPPGRWTSLANHCGALPCISEWLPGAALSPASCCASCFPAVCNSRLHLLGQTTKIGHHRTVCALQHDQPLSVLS